jgi:hypothetical protein
MAIIVSNSGRTDGPEFVKNLLPLVICDPALDSLDTLYKKEQDQIKQQEFDKAAAALNSKSAQDIFVDHLFQEDIIFRLAVNLKPQM